MNGSHSDVRILVFKEIPNGSPGRFSGNTVKRPKGGDGGLGSLELINIARLGKSIDGSLDHGRPLIGEPIGLRLGPIQFQAAGVFGRRHILSFNPVDGAKNIGFGDLGSRATNHVPAAGVRHQKAPIRIFDHVGGMKVALVALQQHAHPSRISRSLSEQLVPGNSAQVEIGTEQIASHSKRRALRHYDSRRCGGAHVGEDGQQGSRTWVRGKNAVVALAIGSSVHCMQDPIPPAWLRQIKEGTA